MTLNQIKSQLNRLVQKQAGPPHIVVVWPGDDLDAAKAAAKPNDVIFYVVYDEVDNNDPTGHQETA